VRCILCVCVSKCKGGRLCAVCARERASERDRGGGRGREGGRDARACTRTTKVMKVMFHGAP
jgi:hypothetical protein